MPGDLSFTPGMIRCIEALAAWRGIDPADCLEEIIAEAVQDMLDGQRCTGILEERGKDPETFTHDGMMREFGLSPQR